MNIDASCFFSEYLNHLVLHFNNTFGVFLLEFYDSTFLKRMQLLIDGDVESNPGPTQNIVDQSPMKGRPKKVKVSKGHLLSQSSVLEWKMLISTSAQMSEILTFL